ncbi:adenylate/guanylate cyclase domain-containing protein [Paenibacillus sp. RC67]|uniref:adenylate/guanylate cyclase domain-containing protein n=1 Tax=Paenibacillus sp. RC67 TaxID=3039392 RepID=UPI0024AC8376|nr:adenylate/guanylate cyclase domain-containing protein [Paenibacillus sp. RC67]
MPFQTQKHTYEKEFALPRHKVWELLSNTDHLNRVIGLFPVQPGPVQILPDAIYHDLTAKVAGVVSMSWHEYPFQWTQNERYSVVREYLGGPLKRFYGGIVLEDAATVLADGSKATRVRLFAEFTPAHALGVIAIPMMGVSSMRKTLTYLYDCVSLKTQNKDYMLPQPKSKYEVNHNALNGLLDKLSQIIADERMICCFREHLTFSGDDEVVDMRPYRLASSWKVRDREQTLRMFLYATQLGITNLTWNLICPNCRVSKSKTDSLSQLQPQYHCDFCGIDYTVSFDRYVELCFSVHSSIRQARKQLYCIGGPMITPHIIAQTDIAAGRDTELIYPNVTDRLRLRVLRANHVMKLAEGKSSEQAFVAGMPDSSEELEFHYDGSQWLSNQACAAAPGTRLRLSNQSESHIIVVLEKSEWEDITVTAAKVTAMHEFRSLFSSEVLAPGQQVGIENVTLLFSDLQGSTAFYETVGDAHAYGQVRKHFDFLTEWVTHNQGTIVKTIGDAIMAVFVDQENAVKAALDIQLHVDEFNRMHPSVAPMVIKMGLYSGPAIAVNSNDILDYFGRTVNMASRAQGLSRGEDIVIGSECMEREGVQAILKAHPVHVEPFEQKLKGIEGMVPLIRVRLRHNGNALEEIAVTSNE